MKIIDKIAEYALAGVMYLFLATLHLTVFFLDNQEEEENK